MTDAEVAEVGLPIVQRLAAMEKRRSSVDFAELESAGRVGLMKAARSWNAEKGPFEPWAIRWIRAQMRDASRHCIGVISLPRRARTVAAQLRSGAAPLRARGSTIRAVEAVRAGGAPVEAADRIATGEIEEIDEETRAELHRVLEQLPAEDAHVVRLRLGLYPGTQPATLEAVSEMCGKTRELIRLIQIRAFEIVRKKLRKKEIH